VQRGDEAGQLLVHLPRNVAKVTGFIYTDYGAIAGSTHFAIDNSGEFHRRPNPDEWGA
jgi:hypothetical protein